jgi:hypothetical protein
VRAVSRLCEFYPSICLTSEEKARKTSVRVKKKKKKKPTVRVFSADCNPVSRLFRHRTQEARGSNNLRYEENFWAFRAGIHAAGDEEHYTYVVIQKRKSKCQLF